MPKLCLVGLLALALAGCSSVVTPLEPRRNNKYQDPMLKTPEQQALMNRSLYAFPDEELGPKSGTERTPLAPPGD
jgi:uncharacterized protein YceK